MICDVIYDNISKVLDEIFDNYADRTPDYKKEIIEFIAVNLKVGDKMMGMGMRENYDKAAEELYRNFLIEKFS